MTYFDVPVQQSLLDIICTRVEYGSTIFTDEYRAYDHLEEHGFMHKSVTHSQKEYANGTIHVNNCVNAEAKSLSVMDKKVHGCKQIQFTGIFQGISVYS